MLGVLLGIRVIDGQLRVRPNLPVELRTPGKSYSVRLTCRGVPVTVTLRTRADGVDVDVDGNVTALAWGAECRWDLGA